METIKVNMTPCEDIKTIHASQNDNEAREWGFELHNNGDKIDSSSISDQLVFKAYKGGTEQILPVNGSTPTTSPFKGDIKYPQGLLSDQEFLYRESPTEEDGLANIVGIKGQTLKWNQIQPNNISRTNNGITYTYDNGKLTVTGTATSTSWWLYGGLPTMSMKANHKYLFVFGEGMANSSLTTYNWYLPNSGQRFYADGIITINSDTDQCIQLQVMQGYTIDTVFYPQVFDLTQMFGSGNEPTTVDEFTSLFSLPYYAYNQGTLLSFMGNGIKTVGKNQIKLSADALVSSQRIGINYSDNGAVFTANGTYSRAGYTFKTIKGQQYTISFKGSSNGNYGAVYISNDLDWNANYGRINLSGTETNNSLTFTANSELFFVGFYLTNTGTSGSMTIKDIQLELGSSVTSYVPYTSSTLSLPISTYFSNGMKSAGSVYDELTETKAITRVGSASMSALEWEYDPASAGITYARFNAPMPSNYKKPTTLSERLDIACAMYEPSNSPVLQDGVDKTICGYTNGRIYLYDFSCTTVEELKTKLANAEIYYPLATPIETPITTASLVTENAEIPLSNEDGVLIGKCTEQLSSDSGFFDAKIKLADTDGECYSNKLQLHVERKP